MLNWGIICENHKVVCTNNMHGMLLSLWICTFLDNIRKDKLSSALFPMHVPLTKELYFNNNKNSHTMKRKIQEKYGILKSIGPELNRFPQPHQVQDWNHGYYHMYIYSIYKYTEPHGSVTNPLSHPPRGKLRKPELTEHGLQKFKLHKNL